MNSEVQSVLISKDKYTIKKAIKFIKENFKFNKIDYTENNEYYRFRQTEPEKYKTFRTVPLKGHEGIKLIIGYL